jgi:tight adherence protein B
MGAALFAFITVSSTVVVGYVAGEAVARAIARRRLERRLHELAAAPEGSDSPLVVESPEAPLPAIERLIRRTRAGARLAALIEQAAVTTTPGTIVLACAALGAVAAAAAAAFVRQPIVIVAAAAGASMLPIAWLRRCRTVRLARFEEQFPEALDLLARAIRAGHAFQTGLGMVASELAAPVGPEFKQTFEQQNFGLPLDEALAGLAARVPLVDVRFFATAVAIQRETGGNLAEILDNLAHVVRERFTIRRQVRVHTAHGRFTAYVLLALPAALAVGLSILSPDQMKLLFFERLGQTMLAGAIVLQTIGFFWIRRVIRIEV